MKKLFLLVVFSLFVGCSSLAPRVQVLDTVSTKAGSCDIYGYKNGPVYTDVAYECVCTNGHSFYRQEMTTISEEEFYSVYKDIKKSLDTSCSIK